MIIYAVHFQAIIDGYKKPQRVCESCFAELGSGKWPNLRGAAASRPRLGSDLSRTSSLWDEQVPWSREHDWCQQILI